MVLKQLYIIFLGVLLALFISAGITAFYTQPEFPKPIFLPAPYSPLEPGSKEERIYLEKEKANQDIYTQRLKDYNRNVSIISLISAIIFMILGLLILSNLKIITDGFLLGGLFTLIYSLFRGFNGDDNKYRFIIVSISLIVVIFIGYIKFIRATGKNN